MKKYLLPLGAIFAFTHAAFSQAAGSISIQNLGPCNLTNITTTAKTVGLANVSGTVTIGNSVPGDFPIISGTGGMRGLTNGQISVIGSAGLATNQSATVMVWMSAGTNGTVRFIGQRTVYGTVGGGAIIGVYPDCFTNPPPCISNSLPVTVENKRNMYGIAAFYKDGVLDYSVFLPPNGVATHTYTWCRTVNEPGPYFRYGMSYSEDAIIPDGEGGYAVGENGGNQELSPDLDNPGSINGATGTGAGSNPNTLNPTNAPLTGSLTNNNATQLTNGFPINWNSTDTTAARDATLRAGFNKIAQQLQSVINGEIMINQTLQSQSNVTVNVNVTNTGSASTNGLMSAFYSDDWMSLSNVSNATNGGITAMTSGSGAVADLTNNASLLTPGTETSHSWIIRFMGEDVDFNPFTRWPAIATTSRWAWGFTALVAFMIWASAFMKTEVVSQMATMQTGGVPNMEMHGQVQILGTGLAGGGNFLGMFVAIAVRVVITVLIAAALIFASGKINDFVTGYLAEYSTSSVPGTFWYLANLLIPVALVMGLMGARVTIPLTTGAAQALTIGAMRWLPGK